jgi:tyrosinase
LMGFLFVQSSITTKDYNMKTSTNLFVKRILSYAFLVAVCSVCSCSTVPVTDEPGADFRDYPLVEVEINNTATTADDYVYTTAVPCRARLINNATFTSPVPVRIRNYNLPTYPGPAVTFRATSAAAFAANAQLDLPIDGSWASFDIIGDASNVSVRDKDVVIEIIENRSAPAAGKNVVLTRKGLMVTNAPLPAVTPQIELVMNGSHYEIDDYVTLSPVYCYLRLVNHESISTPVNVRLGNYSGSVGILRFATEALIAPTPHSTVSAVTVYKTPTNSTLDLTVPGDGSIVPFYVSGEYVSTGASQGPTPSVKDKDAVIEVIDQSTSAVYGRWGTMVRLRKNANTLQAEERDRYLNALSILNASFGAFEPFINIHDEAAEYNHSFCLNPPVCSSNRQSPSFLPWHRIFLLRIEQDLQAIDPSVAIPYWRYDEPAPNVFHRDFMGRYVGGSTVTDISSSNPLFSWYTGTGPDFRRSSNYDDQLESPTIMTDIDHYIFNNSGTIVNAVNFNLLRQILEGTSHGEAHNNTGANAGWIVDFDRSPTDPLFYMLHANVDRIWAKWQSRAVGRYEPEYNVAYTPQSSFPSPPTGTAHIGSYLLDEMWPWNEQHGGGTLTITDWPLTSYAPFPITPGNVLVVPIRPRPFDAIDYRNSRLNHDVGPFINRGLGYHYDDEIFAFNTAL